MNKKTPKITEWIVPSRDENFGESNIVKVIFKDLTAIGQ